MTPIRHAIAGFAAVAVIALMPGCANAPADDAAAAAGPGGATPATAIPDGFEIGQLPAQELRPGECGLFLFVARPTPRFVFFSNAAKATALMKLDGELVRLARSETAGEVFDQQYSEQVFIAPAQGIEAKLSIRRGRKSTGGSRIDGGSIRLSRENGWNMVLPVAGATACETRQGIDR